MIIETSGDLLKYEADVLVNPVNCVGIMGKGLALQFKKEFPENFNLYRDYCRKGNLHPGYYFSTNIENKIILNLATKDHWRNPSHLADIELGIDSIRKFLNDFPNLSIAIPALGCGLGQLDWHMQVKPLIFTALSQNKSNTIYLYGPQ